MINIPKQLWYVGHTVGENDLAYMTYYEDNAAFLKRRDTGMSWAYRGKHEWCSIKGGYLYPNYPDRSGYGRSSNCCEARYPLCWDTPKRVYYEG